MRAVSERMAQPSPPAPLPEGEGRDCPRPLSQRESGGRLLARRAKWFAAIVSVQLLLAAVTWVANYGWPAWFTRGVWPLESSVMAQGRLLVLVTTAHAAIGSLTLVAALSLTLWLTRLLPSPIGRGTRGEGRAGFRVQGSGFRDSNLQISQTPNRPSP